MPNRVQPPRQRFAGSFQQSADRYREITVATSASPVWGAHLPNPGVLAPGANGTLGPAKLFEIGAAGVFTRKPAAHFAGRQRIGFHPLRTTGRARGLKCIPLINYNESRGSVPKLRIFTTCAPPIEYRETIPNDYKGERVWRTIFPVDIESDMPPQSEPQVVFIHDNVRTNVFSEVVRQAFERN